MGFWFFAHDGALPAKTAVEAGAACVADVVQTPAMSRVNVAPGIEVVFMLFPLQLWMVKRAHAPPSADVNGCSEMAVGCFPSSGSTSTRVIAPICETANLMDSTAYHARLCAHSLEALWGPA